jgi:hypothetical protein
VRSETDQHVESPSRILQDGGLRFDLGTLVERFVRAALSADPAQLYGPPSGS